MTYPDRRSASISVPYSQTTRTSTTGRFESPPGDIPWTMSSFKWNVVKRTESRDVMVRVTLCFS